MQSLTMKTKKSIVFNNIGDKLHERCDRALKWLEDTNLFYDLLTKVIAFKNIGDKLHRKCDRALK